MDPKVWNEPEVFRPERFLTSEGKLVKPRQFMPFGTGLRRCLGENVAEMTLQLFFSSILQKFTLEQGDQKLPGLEEVKKLRNHPRNFEVCFRERKRSSINESYVSSKSDLSDIFHDLSDDSSDDSYEIL